MKNILDRMLDALTLLFIAAYLLIVATAKNGKKLLTLLAEVGIDFFKWLAAILILFSATYLLSGKRRTYAQLLLAAILLSSKKLLEGLTKWTN